MDQNLSEARLALEAEMRSLTARAHCVMEAIAALQKIQPPGKDIELRKQEKPARKVKVAESKGDLPRTGDDWFCDLMTNEPQTRKEIAEKMKEKVGFEMSKAQLAKMQARLSFYLTNGVRTGFLGAKGDKMNKSYFIKG